MPIYAIGDKQPVVDEGVWLAPSADVMGDVRLAKGVSVWFNATIRGDDNTIRIGEDTNIQDGVVVHTDPRFPTTIGARVTVGHQAMIHGCTIHDNVLVGIGSTILDGAVIGKNTLIGAHSLIGNGKEIPEGVLVLGAPGKVVRQLSEEEIQFLELSARTYAEKSRMFAETLKVVG